MSIVMFMLMMMPVTVIMFMLMFMFVTVLVNMFVMVFFRQHNVKIPGLDPALVHTFIYQFVLAQVQLSEFFFQIRKRHPCINQGPKHHVAADSGKGFYK